MTVLSDARSAAALPPAWPLAPAATLPPPAETAGGMGAGDVWRIVKRRKWLILIVFALLYSMVVGATFLTLRKWPLYPSEAYVQFVPPPEVGNIVGQPILPKDYIMHQLATEAARMKDPLVLMDLLALPEVKATSYYKDFGVSGEAEGIVRFEKCLNDLRRRLAITPVRDTYLIRVGLALREKEEATLLVNKLVDRYLQKARSTAHDDMKTRVDTLKERRAAVVKLLDDARNQIKNIRSSQDIPAMEQQRTVQTEVIRVLNNTTAELRTRMADVEAQLANVRGQDPRNLPTSAEMRVIIESDPVLRYYRQQVELLDVQKQTMLERIGPEHRTMRELEAQRASLLGLERDRREELIDDLRSRQVEALQQEMARVRNMQVDIGEQLAQHEATQRDVETELQKLAMLDEDAELLQHELEQLGQQFNDAQNQLDLQDKEGRLQPAIAARNAVRPSRPNFVTWLGGGAVLALLVAVGLAFLREFTDQAIRTPLDVTRYGHLSVLGCVPLLDDEEADIAELELATRRAPHSLVAEAFRQIRAHLTFSGPLDSQRMLLITSPRPDDGKTASAINLAVTFAQGNQRTLLVDANFRRPGVARSFAGARSEGLSNILVGHSRFEDVVSPTDLPNLDVLTSGPMPPNPAELLGAQQMRDLLQSLRARYDRVVIDGPPCLLVSDALVVATQVDAVVLVARAVAGTKGTLRRAREQLQRIGARVIGAVLNGVETRAGGYFKQQYREFYEYSEEEVLRELPGGQPLLEADARDADVGPPVADADEDEPGRP